MKLEWDKSGERFYETGLSKGVCYQQNEEGKYPKGVAWNGLTGFTESPSGAELTDLYADDIKYASLRSAETFGGTVEAYTYPDEFAECDGTASPANGISLGQQPRKSFGMSYQTKIGNDVTDDLGYKIHLIYGCSVSPSEKAYQTVNDSPEAITFSWELTTTPVNVEDHKPTALIVIDSRTAGEHLAKLEEVLYGSAEKDARLPLPDEVLKILETGEETEAV